MSAGEWTHAIASIFMLASAVLILMTVCSMSKSIKIQGRQNETNWEMIKRTTEPFCPLCRDPDPNRRCNLHQGGLH